MPLLMKFFHILMTCFWHFIFQYLPSSNLEMWCVGNTKSRRLPWAQVFARRGNSECPCPSSCKRTSRRWFCRFLLIMFSNHFRILFNPKPKNTEMGWYYMISLQFLQSLIVSLMVSACFSHFSSQKIHGTAPRIPGRRAEGPAESLGPGRGSRGGADAAGVHGAPAEQKGAVFGLIFYDFLSKILHKNTIKSI